MNHFIRRALTFPASYTKPKCDEILLSPSCKDSHKEHKTCHIMSLDISEVSHKSSIHYKAVRVLVYIYNVFFFFMFSV